MNDREQDIEEAASRYSGFHGNDPETIESVEISNVAFTLGETCAIEYKIIDEDGKEQFYRHEFETPPALAITSDGETAIILSGEWSFTERGFEG